MPRTLSGKMDTCTYEKRFDEIAYQACRRFGFTAPQLAGLFNVSLRTIYNWRERNSTFFESMQKGLDEFTTEKVERSFAERAIGYTYTEVVEEEIVLRAQKKGSKITAPAIKRKTTIKHVPADVTAGIFWLINQGKGRWQHVAKIIHTREDTNSSTMPENETNKEKPLSYDDPARIREVLRVLNEAGALDKEGNILLEKI